MADILKGEGGFLGRGDRTPIDTPGPVFGVRADYPRWWEKVQAIEISPDGIIARPSGRILSQEEWDDLRAETDIRSNGNGTYPIDLSYRINLSQVDNLILFDGEKLYFPVVARKYPGKFETGIALVNGQQFPVWREEGNVGWGNFQFVGKPWHLGRLVTKRYRIYIPSLKGKAYKKFVEEVSPLCDTFNEFGGTGLGTFASEQVQALKVKYGDYLIFTEVK